MTIYTPQRVATIYKATNKLNGKSYIGFDSKWPNRQNEHRSSFEKESTIVFYRALKKYGWDNFSWGVLYQSTDIEHTLSVMENHFILENNSYDDGYNMTLGGEGTPGLLLSEERKLKISGALTFVERASEKHNWKYDYSKVEYKNQHTLITIVCPAHGEFQQLPKTHLMGYGCQYCSGNISDTNYFVSKSKKKHGDRFSYENVAYTNSVSQVKNILCPVHGLFTISSPEVHYRSKHGGCPVCSGISNKNSKLFTTEDFINRSKENHGDKYDYSNSVYLGASKKISIICGTHGEFSQRADWHMGGGQCPKCSLDAKWDRSFIF